MGARVGGECIAPVGLTGIMRETACGVSSTRRKVCDNSGQQWRFSRDNSTDNCSTCRHGRCCFYHLDCCLKHLWRKILRYYDVISIFFPKSRKNGLK